MFDFSTITEIQLSAGQHANPAHGLCLMEMVAWFAGEPHTAVPECACPSLTYFGMGLNDAMAPEQRDRLLKPLVPVLAGTRGTLADKIRRAEFLFHWVRGSHKEALDAVERIRSHADDCEGLKDEHQIWSAGVNADMRACDAADIAIYLGRSGQGWEHAVEGLRQAVLIGPHWGLPPHVEPEARLEALKLEISA